MKALHNKRGYQFVTCLICCHRQLDYPEGHQWGPGIRQYEAGGAEGDDPEGVRGGCRHLRHPLHQNQDLDGGAEELGERGSWPEAVSGREAHRLLQWGLSRYSRTINLRAVRLTGSSSEDSAGTVQLSTSELWGSQAPPVRTQQVQ